MNEGLRYESKGNGELFLLSAYCPSCDEPTCPDGHGYCLWCGLRIVAPLVARGKLAA